MYNYSDFKTWILSDEGQRAFITFRDKAKTMLEQTGSFTLGCAIGWGSGDSWQRIALVDRMVELGELTKVERPGYASQSQVYVKA
jgi:hypothetical protein